MNLARIFEETKSNAVDGCITPAFVKEATSAVKMVKVIIIDLAAPELHVCNFKIAPKVAGGESIGLPVVVRSVSCIGYPFTSAILVDIVGMVGEELLSLGPNRRHRLRIVIEINGEAVSLVVVVHISEDIIIDVTEEMDLGFNSPVVACVLQSWVLVEEATIPSTHLVIGDHLRILNTLLLEDFGRFVVQLSIDPGGGGPMFVGDDFY